MLTEEQIKEIQEKTTFEIPATAEAHAEVMSRTMWKPKPVKIPKNSASAGAYQLVLQRAHFIIINHAKGEQEDIKQRMTYHYKIWKLSKNAHTAERIAIRQGKFKELQKINATAKELRTSLAKEKQKTEKLVPGMLQFIPESMFDLVLDNWHIITSKTFKIR